MDEQQAPEGPCLTTAPSGAPASLAAALSAAQGEIVNPAKGAENPHFKSRYANLVDGLRAIKAPLARHGIAVVQSTRIHDDLLILTTRLIHAGGEAVESEWPVANWSKLSPQQMGSALTYARRYSLFSLVGISGADDDDDGEAADAAVIDLEQIVYLEQQIRDTDTDLAKFLKALGAESIPAMTTSQWTRGKALLAEKKRRANAAGRE